mmetsp:Transcript_39210/g.124643  ORF Transcript_39210/g.124643 Transcript_39210/m.124643 type:complete len:213 (+) Transcript_39210:126-764(+)
MASSTSKPDQILADYEAVYQPKCVNVKGQRWTNCGYVLIGCSTVIMIMQALAVGPPWVWKRADDVTTVLFTLELLLRIFELEYEFFVGDEKTWNFFDTLVVAISVISMIIAAKAAQDQGNGGHTANSAAMNKMKVLRTLRLLRLLRIFRVLKCVEKVNQCVETLLTCLQNVFVAFIAAAALVSLVATVVVAFWATARAWLREHSLPELPQID